MPRQPPPHAYVPRKRASGWLRDPLQHKSVHESGRFPAQPEVLATRVKSLCDARGIGMRVLAYRAGIGLWVVLKIIRAAHKDPSVWSIARIARVLGVSVDYLVGLTDDHERISDSNLPVYAREDR